MMKEKEDSCAKVFEYVLDEVGHFGYFQKRLFLLSSWLQILATPVILYCNLLTDLPVTYSQQCEDINRTILDIHINSCINTSVSGPIHNLPQVNMISLLVYK